MKSSFPYIPSGYKTRLLTCLSQTLPDEFPRLDGYLKSVLPDHYITRGLRGLLLKYFEKEGIRKPPEAHKALYAHLANEGGQGDGLRLLLGVLDECGLHGMSVKRFRSLAHRGFGKLGIELQGQGVGGNTSYCVRNADVPSVKMLAEKIKKMARKGSGVKVEYKELPVGTSALPLNEISRGELSIQPSNMNRILENNTPLRRMVYVDKLSMRRRVVRETDVEKFLAAVKRTPEYGEYRTKIRAGQVPPSDHEISDEFADDSLREINRLIEDTSIYRRRRI